MKFAYDILPAQRLNLVRFSGAVSPLDVTRSLEQFWADERYDPSYNGIVSLEGVTTRAGIGDIKPLISFFQHRQVSLGRWAAIFTEPKPTALALIFKAVSAAPFDLEVVASWEAACHFLKVQLPPDAAL